LKFGFDVDNHVSQDSPKDQFKEDRLEKKGISKSQWASQIDRAALDIHYGIAIGANDDLGDIGGTIGRLDFPHATGEYYIEGLSELAGENSNVYDSLRQYESEQIGRLVFQLNTFRYRLQETGQELDIDRAIEAFLEKQATSAIEKSSHRDRNAGAGVRQIRDTDSVSDLIMRLFSSSSVTSFAGQLMRELPKNTAESDELLRHIDSPFMTTPLWKHQHAALKKWVDVGQKGYVDMATATGKTVLGLAAIAYRHGMLHPADKSKGLTENNVDASGRPRILIVAGNEVLLKQWRDEFDSHLDIPKGRTVPVERDGGQTIELDWGDIDFRTAQQLLGQQDFTRYDLTILDEAHRYKKGSSSGGRWGDLFKSIVEQSGSVLAMSGSVDGGWTGDKSARNALEEHLERCIKFSVAKARDQGVIADFTWEIRYAEATKEDQQKLANQTQITSKNYDGESGKLNTNNLNVASSKIPSPFTSYRDIRSFVQSSTGNKLRESSKEFDMFASALLSRRPIQWNAAPKIDSIVELVDRHAPDEKTVVLVQSYKKAELVQNELIESGHAEEQVIALESGSHNRHEKIQEFNNLPGGVIIGPGTLLGVGVNMPDAEVAVNVSRGRVNSSLVQRIGRVLRNPEGNKEAHFYHLVPLPTNETAIDFVEDGARLLRQAAEFRALGESFKEPPIYTTTGQEIDDLVVRLEDEGVKLLERVDEIEGMVDAERAIEFVRRLQADIYDAQHEHKTRKSPIVTSRNDPSDETTATDNQQFPKRNEKYEQYRLALGPYRAAKAVAKNHLESDYNERDDEKLIELSKEFEGTKFHNELERWFKEYRSWRRRCDNRDGTGEPGSLPKYKEEWPEPRDNEGAMLTAKAAATLGIDYSRSDPIFFPKQDGVIYELPLPGEEKLTVDGIVTTDKDTKEDSKPNNTYKISTLAVKVVQETISEERYESVDAYVQESVSQLLKSVLDDKPTSKQNISSLPNDKISVNLPQRHLKLFQLIVDDEDDPHKKPDEIIESAILQNSNFETTESREVTLKLDQEQNMLLAYAKQNEDVKVEEYIQNLLQEKLEELI